MGLDTGRWSGRQGAPPPSSTHTHDTQPHTQRHMQTPFHGYRGQVTGF